MIQSLTVKTKGVSDSTSGYAKLGGAILLSSKIIADIEKAALDELSKDKKFNHAELNPTVTNISINRPYSDEMCNVMCEITIGDGLVVDVLLHDYDISFNLEVN